MKRLLSAILVFILSFSAVSIGVSASTTPSDWALDEVNNAISAGLVTDSVRKDYQADITREQFCEMVVRAYEKISNNTAEMGNITFSDTDNAEILKAANLGIVSGYGGGIFAPNDLITREQIAAMLVRMIDSAIPYANINIYNNNYFADGNSISDWAVSSVNFAYDNELMQGVGDNRIDPQANTTCEQAVLLAYRTVNKYYDEEARLDGIYELTEEHIAQDNETHVHYTDNIILAFIERGLSEEEKNDIAAVVDGEVAAQLAGSINLLQIEVNASSLDELNDMAERLMNQNDVYYASPDILSMQNINSDISDDDSEQKMYSGEDEWWYKIIGADKVWNDYGDFITGVDIGEIETGTIEANHLEFADRLTFAESSQKEFNDIITHNMPSNASHATSVAGIMCADREDDIGISGIANNSNLIFATYQLLNSKGMKDEFSDYFSYFGEYMISAIYPVYLLKKEIDAGAKVINCSFGLYYYNEEYFNNHKDEDEFSGYDSYDAYRFGINSDAICCSRIVAMGMCQLINSGKDFLVVQGAGNGENNHGPGVDAKYGSWWNGITAEFSDIYSEFGLSYNDVKNRMLIVGASDNNKTRNYYTMTYYSNYGETVDICAPGGSDTYGRIKSCDSVSSHAYTEEFGGTSAAAPIVAASAAVLWGIDKSLKAEQVKEILIESADAFVEDEETQNLYPMLNLYSAVEQLIHPYSIAVLDKDTNEFINGATVEYYNGITTTTETMGIGDIIVPDGKYTITVSKDGYKSVSKEIEFSGFKENEFIDVPQIYLEKEDSDNSEEMLLDAFIDHVVGPSSDYLYFLPDDYNGDGLLEAFGITGWGLGEDIYSNVDIWFIDSQGNCSLVKSDISGFLVDPITTSNGKFINWYWTAGGSGGSSIILSCKGGQSFEPQVSEKYDSFVDRDTASDVSDFETLNCDYIGYSGYFKDGGGHMWRPVAFDYNTETREFIERASDDFDKLLAGDFSAVAGTYRNALGNEIVLLDNGLDNWSAENDNFQYKAERMTKSSDGAYSWGIMSYYNGEPLGGYGITLYPIGTDVTTLNGTVVNTDKSRIRLWAGNGSVTEDADYIYYKQ